MKVLTAKFEKPSGGRFGTLLDYAPDSAWEFKVETDEEMPHGHKGFGGLLRKTAEGWQARHYKNTEWGKPASDRLTAIQNIVEATAKTITEYKAKQAEAERNRNERHSAVRNLTDAIQKATKLPGEIQVHDSTAWHPEKPQEFEITVKGLTRDQLKKWHTLLKGGE